jgi:serine/threonine protein kinase
MKAALVVANPDPLEEPEETGAAASPSEPEAEAPKKGIFSFLFGASSPTAKASPKSGDSEQQLCVDDFELLKIVGKGAFGKVMLVRKKAGFNAGRIYAMKVLKKSEVIEKGQVEHTKAEQAILVSIRHPYISCLRFSFQNSDKLYLITDYMSGGNLFAHLRKSKMFDENRAKFYAAELILALDHLHQHEIIYRDLKLENILMDGAGHICLTDFGLSKQDSKNGASTFCGTAEYLAPELLKSETYGIEVDWWSFGILLYEMMNGRSPFYDRNRKMMYNRIMNRPPQFAPNIFSHDAATCIQGLLTVDKKQRLGAGPNGAKAIMTTNFFVSIDFDKLFRKEIEPPFRPQGDGVVSTEYVPQEFKAMDARRDSSARAQPVSDPKLAQEMAVAFDGFSFSEENLNKQGKSTDKAPTGKAPTGKAPSGKVGAAIDLGIGIGLGFA